MRKVMFSLLTLVALLGFTPASAAFQDIKVNLMNGNLLTEDEVANKTDVEFGLAVGAEGAAARVEKGAAEAVATLSGKYHSNEHGWNNFKLVIPVEGYVRVTLGSCAWGGDVKITDGAGATVAALNTNTGACYHSNPAANVVEAYYTGGATTLTIAGGNYVPYCSVEAITEADLPKKATVSFLLLKDDQDAEGTLPAATEVNVGDSFAFPYNHTLYKEGFTLAQWTNGIKPFRFGEEIVVNEDLIFAPVFKQNAKALATRTGEATVTWDFQRRNGAPLLNYQGGGAEGIYVGQGEVDGEVIDVKMLFDATNGKIANGSWSDWCQMNGGTKLTIPAVKGMTVQIESYSATTTTTIAGSTDYTTEGNVVTYTYKGRADFIDIVIGNGSYFRYVKATYPEPVESTWRDIKVDLTNANLLTDDDKSGDIRLGVKVEDDGSITRVAADAEEANAVLSGRFHSNEHGWTYFSATVAVEGPVKISLGTCAWGGNVTVKDETGAEVVDAFTTNTGACYHQDKEKNIVSVFYKGDEATLTIAGGSYVPYFAVESVNPEDIPNDAVVKFELGGVEAEGVVPEAKTVEIGKTFSIPLNRTLYVEGATLTAWTDGSAQYAPGQEITVEKNLTLKPVFADNNLNIEEGTAIVAVWDFQQKNGAPVLNYQNKTGIYVTQATIGNATADVKLDFDTNNGGKIANGNWQDWCQMNGGTKLTIPASDGMKVSLECYSATTTTTFDGSTDYTADGNTVTYTYHGDKQFIDVIIGDGSYFRTLKLEGTVSPSEGGIDADAVVIPTTAENPFDITKGTLTGDRANFADGDHIDWMQPGNTATYKLYNAEDATAYSITFDAGTPNDGISIVWTLTDAAGSTVYSNTAAVANTGNWGTMANNSAGETPELAQGYYKLVLTFQAESGSTTANVKNIVFAAIEQAVDDDANIIPTTAENPFVLEKGVLVGDRANFKDGTIDWMQPGNTATYKLYNKKAGQAYKVAFEGATPNDGISIDFVITDQAGATVLSESVAVANTGGWGAGNWQTFTTSATEALAKGYYTMVMTFQAASGTTTVNVQNISVNEVAEPVVTGDWKDIFVDLTGDLLQSSETNEGVLLDFGVKIAADGTQTRVASDDPEADFVLQGTFHDTQHGWTNAKLIVNVPGSVKLGVGNCTYGGHNAKYETSDGLVKEFETTAECWSKNAPTDKVTYAYYKGGATTLTLYGASYTPYFSVEKVNDEDVPDEVNITFALGSEAEGILPGNAKLEYNKDYTLPVNKTLYVEGKTLTGWTDGTETFAPGEVIKATRDLALTPVFTKNAVALDDRTETILLNFDFQQQNGAPIVGIQGTNAFWIAQATIAGQTIDVRMDIDATNGKLANANWGDWAQVNGGTKFIVPSCKGAVITLEAYSEITTTTIDGQNDYATGKTISYTIVGTSPTVEVVIGDGSYYRYVKVQLPVVEKPFEPKVFEDADANIVWALNDATDYAIAQTVLPVGAFTLTTVSVGDYSITVDAPSAGANAGVRMLKLQPDGGDNRTIEFVAKPQRGLTFSAATVKAKVARFGTDAGSLTVSVRNAEGKEAVLATGLIPARNNKTEEDDAKRNEPGFCSEFELDVPDSLATTGSFSLIVTESGLATNKQWGIGDVHIEGFVNGETQDVAKYSFAAQASPERGGSINVYPQGTEFDEGTELKLTATKNFGYRFVNWTDAQGEVVSEEPVFIYTLTADAVLTANFEEVNTYELNYAVAGGANLYQVQLTPAPTVRNDKNMYEEGTEVTLTASSNAILTFNSWSNGETSTEIKVFMDKDYDLVAEFSAIDYIVGWDFYQAGASGRIADFYSTSDNDAAQLVLVDAEGNTTGWLDKSTLGGGGYESMAGAAVNWKEVGKYHYQTKVNAKDFTNIRVKSQLLYNYMAYEHITLDWSLDGQEWHTAGDVTMENAKVVYDLDVELPAEADHAETLYIRWMPDLNSTAKGSGGMGNDGTAITNIFVIADGAVYNDGKAPVLVSTVPADGATGASANGRIVLTFDEKVQVAEGALAYINNVAENGAEQNPTTGVASGKTVTFEYKGLDYGATYNFILPAGSVVDLTGDALQEAVSIAFTVMDKPKVQKALYDFIVPDNGSFKDALLAAAARADKSKRFRIFVKQGDYIIPANESNMVNGSDGKPYPDPKTSFGAPNTSFIGEGMGNTSIANTMPNDLSQNPDAGKGGVANPLEGIRTSGLLYMTSGAINTYFQDITLKTNTPDGTGRNVILVDGGNRTICKDVCLWAYQDTYVSDNTRATNYFEGGLLRGRTDFLCGSGDVFYNQVTLQMCEAGGYIAVPRDNVKYGYVFKDCTIKAEGDGINGRYYLGRPWTEAAEVYYIDTKMEAIPYAEGWANMSAGGCTRMTEWNSTSVSGNPIDVSGRTTVLGGNPNNPWMTADEAEEIGNMANMFGDWDPRQYTEQAPLPTGVVLTGNKLQWDNSDYALLWAVVKNGKVVDFTISPEYTVDDVTAEWAVRAANEMGGLTEAVKAIDTSIETIAAPAATTGVIYDLSGRRVESVRRGGLYIIDGQRVIIR